MATFISYMANVKYCHKYTSVTLMINCLGFCSLVHCEVFFFEKNLYCLLLPKPIAFYSVLLYMLPSIKEQWQ